MKERTNNAIRAREVRVLDSEGENLGVMLTEDAIKLAKDRGEDLIEISAQAVPPICKIMDFGKYLYLESKKAKKAKAGAKPTETKAIQIKIGTGDHDLELKAKTASGWLAEGHRIKVELYLSGRAKYMEEKFLRERLERLLKLITTNFKISDSFKKSPKGYIVTIERDKKPSA